MRLISPTLKARPDELSRDEQVRKVTASIYAAHLAGLTYGSIAAHHGLNAPQVRQVIDAIPAIVRASIELTATDPAGLVMRWRKYQEDRNHHLIEQAVSFRLIVDRVLEPPPENVDWYPKWWDRAERDAFESKAAKRKALDEQICRRWLDDVSYDQIAAEFGISRQKVGNAIRRVPHSRRRTIAREIRQNLSDPE